MRDDETPTDDQIARALAQDAGVPARHAWDTAGEWQRLRARIAADVPSSAHAAPPVRATSRTPRRWLAAAAIVAAAAGTLTMVHRADAPRALTVSTARGERRSVQLDDGSGVVLGPSSSLRFTASRGARHAELRGVAQFRVTHDGSRPFQVRVADASVTDLGTVFTVRAFPDDSAVVVGVTEGRVSLRVGRDSLALSAGESGRATALAVRRIEQPASELDGWATGRLAFHDATIADVARDLSRWFDAEVRVDDRLASKRVSGSYASPELPAVLAAIARAARARVDHADGAFVLRPDSSPGAR